MSFYTNNMRQKTFKIQLQITITTLNSNNSTYAKKQVHIHTQSSEMSMRRNQQRLWSLSMANPQKYIIYIILQYEIYGKIMVLYNVKRILLGTVSFNLFNTSMVREILVQMSSTCSFQVKLASIWTPRNSVFTFFISWLPIQIFIALSHISLLLRFKQHITCFV